MLPCVNPIDNLFAVRVVFGQLLLKQLGGRHPGGRQVCSPFLHRFLTTATVSPILLVTIYSTIMSPEVELE
jgi:hypothetical protein